MKIGVLALQGAFAEHMKMLSALDIDATPVRLSSDLTYLDALIIPGGETTTITRLLLDYELMEPIRQLASNDFPIFGTCAGMILLAKKITDSDLDTIGAMDIEVKRNAFGRQVDSFETELSIPSIDDTSFHGIFIRAPIIEKTEPHVQVLCHFNTTAVAVRQGKLLACSFHPELTDDLRFHRYFVDLVTGDAFAKNNC